jgi:Tol biopolymer transport system component
MIVPPLRTTHMEPTRVLAQLERILTSAVFVDAQRASSFLRFIVERTLDGRTTEIKESIIAIEVLGRSPSFDSKTDPIVRVEAARLRDRLREYYNRHAGADDVFISVPKGAYVPQFVEREPQTQVYDVVRLSILPPAGSDFECFAISPDGRRIAFTAQANGNLTLWVRELDSLEARPLPGTETAAFPFWSPDSRSIGFFTPFKLKIVPASGGPCRELADVVVGRGATWNSQGIILFGPRPVGPLYSIAAEGGTPTLVTTLETERSEIAHAFPQFLPDGRRFIYFAASCRPGESSIRIGSLDSATSTVIVESETSALYAPVFRGRSGCLLFVSHNAMLAQLLDLQTLERRGRPEIVASEVRYRRWGQASMSISNDGLLLYRGGTNENHQFAWIGRQGATIATVGPRNRLASSPNCSFNLSPDGKRVAIHRQDDPDTARPTIWIMDLYRGGTLWRFTEPGGQDADFCPVWNANAAELAFSRGDDRYMRVLRRPLSGGTAISIIDTRGPKFPTDWSDDGGYVAYNSQEPDYRRQHVWIASMNGESRPFLHQTYHAGSARFAPAVVGDRPPWLAYTSNETGRYEIYIRSFPDGAHGFQISNRGGVMPQWRRDGRELFYIDLDGTLTAVGIDLAAAEFGTPDRLFATGLRLTPYSIWMNQYAVANDGESFLLNRPVEQPEATITAVLPR